MRPLLVALVAALGVILAGPAVAGPAGIASAHSQLVSSSPGGGDVVETAPTEIRLVFSEPIEPRYTSLDLLDPVGKTILLQAGTVDPNDAFTLVAQIPPPTLANGSYTVNWRAVSAADGHATSGFITFGVGQGSSGGQGSGDAENGAIHAGHSGPAAIAEVEGKTVGYGGLMLVFGIALLFALFGRAVPRVAPIAANASWILLLVAASGSIVLLVLGAATLPGESGTGDGFDLVGYALGSRTGQLLMLRTLVALLGAGFCFILAKARRDRLAILAGGLAAFVGLIFTALGGHAAGFSSPVPIVVDLVHLGVASLWLAGVVGLFWLIEFSGLNGDELRALVPRFSAVALVSVALIIMTGIYQAWIETYDFTSISSPYSLTLAAKVAVFGAALVFGAFNYFDGGRDRRWLGGFRTRIFLEAGFAVAVIGLAANLTSGSPTSEGRPIEIEQAVSTAPAGSIDSALGIQPGRPGPNRYVAVLSEPAPAGSAVVLELQRLDSSQGSATLNMRPSTDPTLGPAGQAFIADGGQMVDGSSWDASVVVNDGSGNELGRQRFTFAMGPDGISEGRKLPPLDPVLLVGVLLVCLGLAGLAFGLAGGKLPRAAASASRYAMIGGGAIGGLLGLVILSGGPR